MQAVGLLFGVLFH